MPGRWAARILELWDNQGEAARARNSIRATNWAESRENVLKLRMMKRIDPSQYSSIVFFTGAGMSAESGVPTYRGRHGIWHQYNWEDYACQAAFDKDPKKVLRFHELRRQSVLDCKPHRGHHTLAEIEKKYSNVSVVTQNIDGMHQRAGSRIVIELHGSLWRLRCLKEGKIILSFEREYMSYTCECGEYLRPDITWFGDMLDKNVFNKAASAVSQCSLFVSIGTSAVVWPAAGFPQMAKDGGAYLVEVNPEANETSRLYDVVIRKTAGQALPELFPQLDRQ